MSVRAEPRLRPTYGAHRVSTAHLEAVYPCIAESGLGARGAYIGQDIHGGSFVFGPWELYGSELTGICMLVMGQLGTGKSSLEKTLVWRLLALGNAQAFMIDPKGENGPLAAAAGGVSLRLEPGGALRFNPLSPALGDAEEWSEALVLGERKQTLRALCEARLGQPITADEAMALETAIVAATRAGSQPTLPSVVEALLAPSEADAQYAYVRHREELAGLARRPGLLLRDLVHGELGGMFDGDSSHTIDLRVPVVSFDLRALLNSPALGVAMVCIHAWLRRALARRDGVRRMMVNDEAWAVLAVAAEWMQAQYKLSRDNGVMMVSVVHRLSDLDAVGGADSQTVRLARTLMAEAETRVIYRQPPTEVEHTARLLGLNETEKYLVARIPKGIAIWQVGQRSFLVRHRLAPAELPLVDTDAGMRAGRSGE